MFDSSNPVWATAPKLVCLIVVTPLILLTILTLLTALVALFGGKDRHDRAVKLFEITLEGLLWIISAMLRFTRVPQPPNQDHCAPQRQQGKRRRNRGRRR